MYKSFIGNVGRKSGKNMLLRKLRRGKISNRQTVHSDKNRDENG